MLITITVALALSFLYRFTALGRRMLAAGAMPNAAEISGVRVGRTFIACHILSGLLAALAAMMLTARTGAAIPSMAGHLGQDWLLPAFLAPCWAARCSPAAASRCSAPSWAPSWSAC
jgi:ribose transport system permease protein